MMRRFVGLLLGSCLIAGNALAIAHPRDPEQQAHVGQSDQDQGPRIEHAYLGIRLK